MKEASGSGRVDVRHMIRCLLLLASAIGSGACGPSVPSGKVRLAGKVICGTKALAGGVVLLQAVGGTESATAIIGPDNAFSTIVSPGEYAVAVRASEPDGPIDPKRGFPRPGKSLVPFKYDSADTSGITVSAVKGAPAITISLDDQ